MLKLDQLLLGCAAFAAACSSPASPAAQQSTTANDAEAAVIAAGPTYSVPVPPELAPQATFPVKSVTWGVVGDAATLKYDLPKELTGTPQRVEMQGTRVAGTDTYALSGAAGTANCEIASALLTCNERLPGIAVDVPAAAQLASAQQAPAAAAQRTEVVRRFGAEPIGILHAPVASLETEPPETETDASGKNRRGR